jgi:hypothetical protein
MAGDARVGNRRGRSESEGGGSSTPPDMKTGITLE